MIPQTASWPQAERRKPQPRIPPRDYGWSLYLLFVTLVMVAGFKLSLDKWYKPSDELVYNLGLAGGLMMASILVYPLRKRVRFMRNWIIIPKWFRWHMVCGVLGPALIMFHSNFTIGSINAGVAMASMLLVSGSGIFGRFFYTKLHHGIYGRQTTLDQLQEELDGYGNVKSIFSFAPEIQQQLVNFREALLAETARVSYWKFLMVSIRAKLLARKLVAELEETMYADANDKRWNFAQMRRLHQLFSQNRKFIRSYIRTIRDLAQFLTYGRLFSLWYDLHVPTVYILLFSSIWHVIAVHKY
jgi:hypothetical protein